MGEFLIDDADGIKLKNDVKQFCIQNEFLKITDPFEFNENYEFKNECRSFKIKAGNELIASFTLAQLPGCCGVCVSTAAHVSNSIRGKGLGKYLNNIRIRLAKAFKYGKMICTVIKGNVAQEKILIDNGWKVTDEFVNPKTGNIIVTYTIIL